jgi:polysaccharide deacetylase 2 family uncharacterized protein YibQ
MIEFVLYVYLGSTLIDNTQKFEDIDRCLYFAERLSRQRSIPVEDGKKVKLTAVCRPQPK